MSETKNLLQALSEAKVEFAKLVKDTKGVYGKYAPLDSVIEATWPALKKHGLVITHSTTVENGNTNLHTKLHHVDSGEHLESIMPVIPDKPGNQGLGASLTYLKRYQECMLLDLAAEDDDDLGDGKVTRPTQAAKAKPDGRVIGKVTEPSDELDRLRKHAMAICSELMISDEKRHARTQKLFGLESGKDMTIQNWKDFITDLQKVKSEWIQKMGGDTTEFFKSMEETTADNRKALLAFYSTKGVPIDNVLRISQVQFATWRVVLDEIIAKAAQPEL